MAESVETGGLMKFRYEKGSKHKASEDLKKDIQSGYEQYYERKAKELRNKKILWIVVGLVLLILLGLAFWKLF